ncbi:hypothetical protein SAMN04515678_1295 [Roseivivax sediminis]|uniref:Uncharacterized protein n=1 Tax=Roseivivax sediminis TaxID=936889 RepID=A0A1I2EPV7_9RHOB|nr:hypothetical protein SAMN04515678_1295 [Roseivivax sediminis]
MIADHYLRFLCEVRSCDLCHVSQSIIAVENVMIVVVITGHNINAVERQVSPHMAQHERPPDLRLVCEIASDDQSVEAIPGRRRDRRQRVVSRVKPEIEMKIGDDKDRQIELPR